MAKPIYQSKESLLYENLFNEFNAVDEKGKLLKHIDNEITFKEKKYFIFLLVKYDNQVLYSEHPIITSKKSIVSLKERIESKIENIKEKNITISIAIETSTKNNTELLKDLKYEFCQLYQLSRKETTNNFENINNFLFKHIPHIIVLITLTLTLFVLDKLYLMGISMNLISLETLGIIINISIQKTLILLSIIFISMIITFALAGKIIDYFERFSCSTVEKLLPDIFKAYTNLFVFLLFLVVFIDAFSSIRNDKSNNTSRLSMSSAIAEDYILTSRQPSIREIQINDINKSVLFMGQENQLIYYIDENTVQNVLKEVDNNICQDLEDNKTSYIRAIIDLLYLYKTDKYKSISNKRLNIKEIKNVSFTNKLPSFNEAFCKDNNSSKQIK
ncbi:MAG: hypothetical protein U9Q33_09920 [Campylobacterota bacterium]|nr:hypothetical protein [Campylobacterota bacterium]